jgi:hypothetical protein
MDEELLASKSAELQNAEARLDTNCYTQDATAATAKRLLGIGVTTCNDCSKQQASRLLGRKNGFSPPRPGYQLSRAAW